MSCSGKLMNMGLTEAYLNGISTYAVLVLFLMQVLVWASNDLCAGAAICHM
jgi:hypothetical protein